jgi:Bacterial Ig-like domain (group 3)/FG-GAP-like repeat
MSLPFSARLKLAVTSLLLFLLPAGIAQATAPLFPVEPSITLTNATDVLPSSYREAFLPGDFNGDGLLDSVAMLGANNPSGTSILVLLSNKGSTPTQVLTPVSCTNYNPIMATADLNHDGKLDLVLYCGGNYLQAYLGNGDGTFQAPILEATPTSPGSFTLADFNGDGFPDLAYLTSGGFAIALNLGNGHFGNSQTYTLTEPANFLAIASGDFNGDGKQDLIFSSLTGSAAYVLGNGNGTFGAQQALPGNFNQFVVGDFNHDGYSDVAYFSADINPEDNYPFDSNLVVLLGGSNGLAASGQTITTNGSIPFFLVAVDLTGSGNLDLVLENTSSSEAGAPPSNTLVFLGDAKGNFSPPMSYAAYSVYGIVDLNGDGFPDLVGVNNNGTGVLPYAPGVGDGSFQALPNTPYGQSAQTVSVADMNGDGIADALLYDQNGVPLVFLGQGNGRFNPVPNTSLPAALGTIVPADFNGDGKIDIASIVPGYVPANASGAVAVYLGNGDGTLTFKQQTSLNLAEFYTAVAGDFNGDNKQDLVLLYYNILTTESGAVFLPGNGDGTFGAPQAIQLLSPPNLAPTTIQAIDLNGDGITDLIIDNDSYLGNTKGTFTALQVLPGTGFVADLDGDGKLELVTSGTGTLNVYTSSGGGTFSANPISSNIPLNLSPGSYAVGDLNGDGLSDIAAEGGNGINVFLNQGGGSFSEDPTSYFAVVGTAGQNMITDPYVGSALALVRSNANSPAAGSHQMLDALAYGSGGLTSLLNQLNAAPKPLPAVSVSLADGVTSITTGATVTVNASLFVTGTTAPTGTITFFAGATQIGATPVSDGSASVSAPITGSGAVVIRAVYSGDTTFGTATGYASLTVNAPVATTTTLSASPTSVDEQQKVTLTATVQGNSPTGTVTFLNGTTSLGTAPISGNSASLTTSFASAGSVSLTASYAGDPNNLTSTSSPITVTVVAPSFAVAVSPASATITSGQSATFTVTVTPAGGFATAVTLSCGALPSQASCAFATPSVTPGGGQPVQVKLTVSTAASTANLRRSSLGLPRREPWIPAGAVVSLAGLLGLARVRRASLRWRQLLQAMALLTIAWALSASFIGCGGGGGTTPSNPGTPAGTSTISISATATGSSSPQTASVQLIVQ